MLLKHDVFASDFFEPGCGYQFRILLQVQSRVDIAIQLEQDPFQGKQKMAGGMFCNYAALIIILDFQPTGKRETDRKGGFWVGNASVHLHCRRQRYSRLELRIQVMIIL